MTDADIVDKALWTQAKNSYEARRHAHAPQWTDLAPELRQTLYGLTEARIRREETHAADLALEAQADDILAKLDAFMERTLTLHDVGKALPHPYDAIGDMANGLAHDFINAAFGIRAYVARTRPEGEDHS